MNTIRHKTVLLLGVALCFLVLGIIFLRQVFSSAFFVKEDRINILFYSASPIYFSLEKGGGDVHYATTFNADSRAAVAGGYGIYRIGALGKLATLEKNPSLLEKTFSRITGSMIDYYFYPPGETIYYGSAETFRFPFFSEIFFGSSNAGFVDRMYIYLQFVGKHTTDFEEIKIKKITEGNSILLSDATFASQYLGYFYHKLLRAENKTVQILYVDSYAAAKNMSRIIDGEGIRVVDIDTEGSSNQTPSDTLKKQPCIIMENIQGEFSQTARELSNFFSCRLSAGKGRVSDIVIKMGQAQGEWE